MKKTINIITLGALLSIGNLYAGGKAIAPAEVIVAPIPVLADPTPFFVGVGLLWAGSSRDCFAEGCDDTIRLKDTTWGGIIRGGYEYNQYIGVELRAITSSYESDWAKTKHYGIFLKPSTPVGDQMNIYGLLGYGHTELTTDCTQLQDKYKYDGFSYGIGLEYDLSDRESDREEGDYDRPFDGQADQEKGWGLWIDYQNLMNNEGPPNYKGNIVTFGVTYDF